MLLINVYNIGTKQVLKYWQENCQPHQKRNDFDVIEGKVNEILYDRQNIIVFSLVDDRTDYILLRESTQSFDQYQKLIRSKPPNLELKIWSGHVTESFSFVRRVKGFWPQPSGVKLILYFDDGSKYTVHGKDNKILAIILVKAMKDNTIDKYISSELSLMLNSPDPTNLPFL
jgi:hypothetical protein